MSRFGEKRKEGESVFKKSMVFFIKKNIENDWFLFLFLRFNLVLIFGFGFFFFYRVVFIFV